MKKCLMVFAIALLFAVVCPAEEETIPVPKKAEEALINYLNDRWFLKEHDGLGHSFSKIFSGVEVYELWRDASQGNLKISSGMQLNLVIDGDSIEIFSDESKMREHLVSLYRDPIKKSDDVEKLFKAIGPVVELVEKDGQYKIFTGEKFFGSRSGYELILNEDGTIKLCEYARKLEGAPDV